MPRDRFQGPAHILWLMWCAVMQGKARSINDTCDTRQEQKQKRDRGGSEPVIAMSRESFRKSNDD